MANVDLEARYRAALHRLHEAQSEVRALEAEMELVGGDPPSGEESVFRARPVVDNPTDKAAVETYLAEHELHLIFQPRGTPNTMTTTQWAARITAGKHPTKSAVTGWRTLGHALMAVGLDPHGDTYTRLRNSNAYAYAEVKRAVFEEGATEKSIAAVLARYADERGHRRRQ